MSILRSVQMWSSSSLAEAARDETVVEGENEMGRESDLTVTLALTKRTRRPRYPLVWRAARPPPGTLIWKCSNSLRSASRKGLTSKVSKVRRRM